VNDAAHLFYSLTSDSGREIRMPPPEPSAGDDALLEQCIDELDGAIEKLWRFPEIVVLYALRAHLASLARVLTERGLLTQEEVAEFSASLVSELTQSDQHE
jgi:hypothetical protein